MKYIVNKKQQVLELNRYDYKFKNERYYYLSPFNSNRKDISMEINEFFNTLDLINMTDVFCHVNCDNDKDLSLEYYKFDKDKRSYRYYKDQFHFKDNALDSKVLDKIHEIVKKYSDTKNIILNIDNEYVSLDELLIKCERDTTNCNNAVKFLNGNSISMISNYDISYLYPIYNYIIYHRDNIISEMASYGSIPKVLSILSKLVMVIGIIGIGYSSIRFGLSVYWVMFLLVFVLGIVMGIISNKYTYKNKSSYIDRVISEMTRLYPDINDEDLTFI